MILRRNYIYIVIATIFLALIIFGVKTLHHEWRSSYTILFQKTYYKVNLLTFQLKTIFEGVYRPLVASREKGLPERRLYISEKSQNILMEDLPSNIRKWQRAFFIYPDGQLRRVQVRHRGDYPGNWAFHRKSWRIKLPKNSLIDNIRIFDLVVPNEQEFNNYFSDYLARLIGILSPRDRLVELFINDQSQGIYHELENVSEGFLRKNKIMPVNIYKGEQRYREKQVTIAKNLFDNPGLWSKLSNFNQTPEADFSDLKYALELIRDAETSDDSLARLKEVARYTDWALFSAFQTLVQSWHNGISVNMRLVSDPWLGTIRPMTQDTESFMALPYNKDHEFDIVLDSGRSHPLLSLYHHSSDFLVEKYRILYKFVEAGLLLKAARHFESYLPALKKSFSRNYYRYERIYTNDFFVSPTNLKYTLAMTSEEGMSAERGRRIGILRWFQGALQEKLRRNPPIRWLVEDGLVGLIVAGAVPINGVVLEFLKTEQLPRSIAWDADGDGRLSQKDVRIPFQIEGNRLILDAAWTSNRVFLNRKMTTEKPFDSFYSINMATVPTQFQLVAEVGLSPVGVRASNLLTGEEFMVIPGGELGNTPFRRNIPVVKRKQRPVEIWSEEQVIEGVRMIDWPVRILSGTTLRMRPGASLVFRNRVEVEGTRNAPVSIISDVPGESWGAVVLQGLDTAGSVLSHLVLENGSGAFVGNIHYIGMLSVHESRNVEFRNLILRKNKQFDDMMHIVYSEDIRLLDCVFQEAFSDGLDIDISTVRIQGCRITGSKNDAIDLMSSRVLIVRSELSHSGDKGISVGEASDAVVYDSSLHQNMIGVESKDGSFTHIINTDLSGNKLQIHAYKKNWRYGKGGSVAVAKSTFSSTDNSIKADKESEVKVYDSTFSNGFGKKDKQVVIDSLSDTSGGKKAVSPNYQPVIAKVLQSWGIKGDVSQRGPLQ